MSPPPAHPPSYPACRNEDSETKMIVFALLFTKGETVSDPFSWQSVFKEPPSATHPMMC